ncbi:MAG: methionyl-tRNA formyltransferase [Pseudomonadota bacterium]
MRIGFFGTPELASYVLGELCNAGHDVKWVVTQPDREAGRGRKITAPPVKEKALSLDIKVFQAEKLDKDFFEKIKAAGDTDVAVVIAYGLYIPSSFIDDLKLAPINIHFSLLPKYRGASPVATAIMNGEDVTGVTIMKISKGMDEGDILAQEKIKIDIKDTTQSLTQKLVEKGTALLLNILEPYKDGTLKTLAQNKTGIEPTYTEKISSEQRHIDWAQKSIDVHNKVRAFYPWPGAESKINNMVVKFVDTMPVGSDEKDPPGTVIDVEKKKGFFVVKTVDGALLVEKVQPSGKREMAVSEFLNGNDIKKGMRFL